MSHYIRYCDKCEEETNWDFNEEVDEKGNIIHSFDVKCQSCSRIISYKEFDKRPWTITRDPCPERLALYFKYAYMGKLYTENGDSSLVQSEVDYWEEYSS